MNINELEKLAKAATPGPWKWYRWTDGYNHVVEDDGTSVTSVRYGGLDDSKYIAAANPQTILAMIELLREMGEALEMYMAAEDIPWSVVEEALAKYKEMTK